MDVAGPLDRRMGYRSREYMIAMLYFAGKLTIHYVPSHGK